MAYSLDEIDIVMDGLAITVMFDDDNMVEICATKTGDEVAWRFTEAAQNHIETLAREAIAVAAAQSATDAAINRYLSDMEMA